MKNKTYILIGILVLYLIFVIFSIGQPFHGDEVVLAKIAKSIVETGDPIIDLGVNNPDFNALVHVPFHVYILSGFVFLFGYNVYSVRAVSVIFNLLIIILIYFITKEILNKNENKEKWALFAAFIYAFNPFTIQSSILIDPDIILSFGMCLFLYLFIKNKNWYYLFPSLLFVFFAKEFGAPLLFLCIFFFYIVTFNWKKIPKLILLFSVCGLIWLGGWWIFARFMNLDFMRPLLFNFGVIFSFGGGGNGGALSLLSLLTRLWNFKNFFYFAVPFFVSLFLILTGVFYFRILKDYKKLKEKDTKKVLLFNILALLIIFLYLFMGGSGYGFPKYHIIAVPSMCIFIISVLANSNLGSYIRKIWAERKWVFIVLGILLLIYFLYFVGDPLMPEADVTGKNADIGYMAILILKSFVLYAVVPFVIYLIVFSIAKIKKKVWICLIYLMLFMFFYLNILHAVVDYSTYAKYGDIGIPEVIEYFEIRNIPASKIVTHLHIGSYLGFSEYNEISFIYDVPELFEKEIVENEDIEYMVIWERDIGRIGKNMKYFDLKEQIGTYYIFKKRL